MKRRDTVVALLALGAAPFTATAQSAGKVHRIGFLGATSAQGYELLVEGLRSGLRDLGYIEGANILIEFRWAEGDYDRLPKLAAQLVRLNIEALVTHGAPGIRAAKQATTTIPIVMAASGDAVATGLVPSIARPSGNVTGMTFFAPALAAKRVELLKEVLPRIKRAALIMNPDNPVNEHVLQAAGTTAKSLNVELRQILARTPEELDGGFAAMTKEGVDAIVLIEDGVLIANIKRIADLASQYRLPSMGFANFADIGGLMIYGVNLPAMFRRAAYFVDKILKGATPADLPVEQPTRFEMAINLKTAKALGLTIPQSVLLRADRVIE